jgi:DNA polymerase-3 subunit delta
MFYVFYGDDEYTIRQTIDSMKARLGDPATAELNTTTIDGRSLSLDELRITCDALPFLSEKRLVIVEGLLARFESRATSPEARKGHVDPIEAGLRAYLPIMADTARLVFVERGALSAHNPLLRMARELGATVRDFSSPSGAALTAWIQKRVSAEGGSISPRAAETLAAFVGGNLRQLAQEIDKLTTYAGEKTIGEADVHRLVADAREIKVWALTDALAAQNQDHALGTLHQLLDEGEPAPLLMAVIARQFRILLQIKELDGEHLANNAIAGQLKMHPFAVQKAIPAARSFSYERIDSAYRRLLDTDLAVKTGRVDPALALDLLVVDLTSA